eukprot:3469154-Pyramimonas_sp.AAC.2
MFSTRDSRTHRPGSPPTQLAPNSEMESGSPNDTRSVKVPSALMFAAVRPPETLTSSLVVWSTMKRMQRSADTSSCVCLLTAFVRSASVVWLVTARDA